MKDQCDSRLESLARLAALVRDRELAKVEQIVAHMNRLQRDTDQLRVARAARDADAALDASRLSGSDVAWQAWTDERLRRTQSQIAALRVTHEASLASARKAFGRFDALSQLSRTKR